MTDENTFLSALRSSPADDTARLVYADWLEEHGDAEAQLKAEYLRLECRVGGLPEDDPNRADLVLQLRDLALRLPMQWKTVVAKTPLENCGLSWKFACPQRWDRLRETGLPYVRHCPACNQNVYFCATIEEARDRAAGGACLALDLRIRRKAGDLDVDVDEEDEDAVAFGLLEEDGEEDSDLLSEDDIDFGEDEAE
jgi:uncharacterized protein (TIGR02996 family)